MGCYWRLVGGGAKPPTKPRAAPTTKSHPDQHINSDKVERRCSACVVSYCVLPTAAGCRDQRGGKRGSDPGHPANIKWSQDVLSAGSRARLCALCASALGSRLRGESKARCSRLEGRTLLISRSTALSEGHWRVVSGQRDLSRAQSWPVGNSSGQPEQPPDARLSRI